MAAYPPPAYAAPASADYRSATAETHELRQARAEIAALRAENESLKALVAELRTGAAHSTSVPPPNFYPPAQHYGYPPPAMPYGYTAPPPPPQQYDAAPAYPGAPSWPTSNAVPSRPSNPPLAINAENKRGPKGANLAIFCIPNSYTDQQVLDLGSPYGKVVYAQVATHRETGLSRGYAFISYETLEQAECAITSLHNLSVEGRALRCEVARSDRDSTAKPY